MPGVTIFLCGLSFGFLVSYSIVKTIYDTDTYHVNPPQNYKMDSQVSDMINLREVNSTEDTTVETTRDRLAKVRILCWIMTAPVNLERKTLHVRATWAKRCDKVLFMSSEETDFPTVGLNVTEGRDQLYWKTIRAFQYIHKNHLTDADWFLKADDDTYVVVENLRYLLSKHDPGRPIYFGRRFRPFVKQGYMSGGAGYVLSKEALRRFVEGFRVGKCTHTSSIEDMALGKCMEILKVEAGDSRDKNKRETFHPFPPQKHVVRDPGSKRAWYWGYGYYPSINGPECCSDFAVSFHYIHPDQMYELEYMVYHLRPYGYQYRFNPDSMQNETEKNSAGSGS